MTGTRGLSALYLSKAFSMRNALTTTSHAPCNSALHALKFKGLPSPTHYLYTRAIGTRSQHCTQRSVSALVIRSQSRSMAFPFTDPWQYLVAKELWVTLHLTSRCISSPKSNFIPRAHGTAGTEQFTVLQLFLSESRSHRYISVQAHLARFPSYSPSNISHGFGLCLPMNKCPMSIVLRGLNREFALANHQNLQWNARLYQIIFCDGPIQHDVIEVRAHSDSTLNTRHTDIGPFESLIEFFP